MIQLFMSAQIAKRGCLALRSAGREQTCFRSPLAGREVPGGCNGGSVGPCSLKPLRLMPRARYASTVGAACRNVGIRTYTKGRCDRCERVK